MQDVLEIFNVRTGESEVSLRVYHTFSSVTIIYEVTFLVGQHDVKARFWKVSGYFLDECSALKNEYLLYGLIR